MNIIGRSMSYEAGKPSSRYYDPDFPKPEKIGHRVRFRASEIRAWLEIKKRRSQGLSQTSYIPEKGSKGSKRNRTAELSSQADLLFPLLIETAKSGHLLTFQVAMSHLRLWPDIPADLSLFEEVLGEASARSYKESKTLLSAVVSESKRFARPLPSFFEQIAKFGGFGLLAPEAFVLEQRKSLWLLHNKLPRGKRLVEIQVRGMNILGPM